MSSRSENESDPESEENKSDPEDNETSSDQNLQAQIFATLQKLKSPSAFAFSTIDESLPNPGLYLPPHGFLGLPLSSDDAQKIISQASQSPFGKGEETIIDTSVRKSWELNPNQFSLKNPAWSKTLEKVLDTVCTGLGLKKGTGKVSAELYKLLLYEPGAFFKPHKDTEKVPGMFATLVVCLPSPHEGGKLVMTLDDDEHVFETAGSSTFGTSYAAWYSDITHEVLPVTSGYRLMLTYNLIRQTDFVIPSFDLVREQVQKLSMLLEQYKSQLEMGDNALPPILLHKLRHKYTPANLQLYTLKPQDLAQVQTLKQLSTKLGFDIYLATLELEVKKEDEENDYPEYDERSQSLENMIQLDGKLIMKSFPYPEGALIDPKPQDAGERRADQEKHHGYSGNAGCPVTYWYRDTVAVLVPPSKKLDFIFGFKSSGTVIGPLYCKLMEEYSKDPAEKEKLENLCERVLKKPTDGYWYRHEYLASIPPYFQQAAAIAFELGRIDLFDEACRRTYNIIILDNGRLFGRWAAKDGVAVVKDRLMKGVQIAHSVPKIVEFLESVAEGFETAVEKLGSAEKEILKQWSDEAIFFAAAKLRPFTKVDAVSLAHLCKSMDWSLFESKAAPVILKAGIMVKIAFIDELMSTLQQERSKEQQSFIEMIIHNIWKGFFNNNDPKEKEIRHIFETTITILSSECVETTIIPAMLAAIPNVPKKCTKELFILLVRMIIRNKLVGFRLADAAVPPSSHKRLVQALLTKFLIANVRHEPNTPTDWSLPVRSCNCRDCAVVNRFLQDPVRETLDIPCPKSRRVHLYGVFTFVSRDCNSETPTYNVATIHGSTPNIWRITKHRRGSQKNKAEWIIETKFATQTLSELKNDEAVEGRLEAYLQPYYSIIMTANVKELPDLESLVTIPQLSETSENTAPNLPTNQTGHKRGANEIDLPEDELVKRTKQEMNSSV